jgi:hypothetical protein
MIQYDQVGARHTNEFPLALRSETLRRQSAVDRGAAPPELVPAPLSLLHPAEDFPGGFAWSSAQHVVVGV